MNLDKKPTLAGLKQIFAARDDASGHHILWINKDGDVRLDKLPEGTEPIHFQRIRTDMLCRFETYSRGCGYVGAESAADHKFMTSVLSDLRHLWSQVKGADVVTYVGY